MVGGWEVLDRNMHASLLQLQTTLRKEGLWWQHCQYWCCHWWQWCWLPNVLLCHLVILHHLPHPVPCLSCHSWPSSFHTCIRVAIIRSSRVILRQFHQSMPGYIICIHNCRNSCSLLLTLLHLVPPSMNTCIFSSGRALEWRWGLSFWHG